MMNDTDEQIAEALSADDRAFLDSLEGERGLFQQIGDSWKGSLGGWAKLIFGFTFALGMLLLYLIWQVAHTREPVEHTLWAISALAVIVLMGFAKEWMFARLNMLTILREVKKLQVQVALLSEQKQKD